MCLIPKFIKDPQTEISQVVLLLTGDGANRHDVLVHEGT